MPDTRLLLGCYRVLSLNTAGEMEPCKLRYRAPGGKSPPLPGQREAAGAQRWKPPCALCLLQGLANPASRVVAGRGWLPFWTFRPVVDPPALGKDRAERNLLRLAAWAPGCVSVLRTEPSRASASAKAVRLSAVNCVLDGSRS